MVKVYWRPIPDHDGQAAADALSLGGTAASFREVERISRDGDRTRFPASALPADMAACITAPRPPIAGLDFAASRVMGIVNVTPDSFSDGGRFEARDAALSHAEMLASAGADILDIGGESTRPGAEPVPEEAEIARVLPVIEALAPRALPLSIDTRKAAVADACLGAGARLFNDVSALGHDPGSAAVAADHGAGVCLMHALADPRTMQTAPSYDDVLLDIYDYLEDRIAFAEAAGILRHNIMVDPGIGFGKTIAHNLALVRGLSLFHGLGCAILFGASRKRFIGEIGGAAAPDERAPGSVAVALAAARQGAHVIRVHDVAETVQALRLQSALFGN